MAKRPEVADHYGAHYRDFDADVYGDVRREAFGIDVGQNSWLTVEALERFGSQLELRPSTRLLDVACGSGGPALHLVALTGCEMVGVELDEDAVAAGSKSARVAGLEMRTRFVQADASRTLPFEDDAFDAILCVDSINHLPDRASVLADWARVLRPGGRLLFTDPVVVTGVLGSDEIAVRCSIGYFLFIPPGENERLLGEPGLSVLAVEDTTEQLAEVARRRHDARAKHAEAVRQVEGDEAFEGRQRFFDIVATLARERRLSRFAYLAEKPGSSTAKGAELERATPTQGERVLAEAAEAYRVALGDRLLAACASERGSSARVAVLAGVSPHSMTCCSASMRNARPGGSATSAVRALTSTSRSATEQKSTVCETFRRRE